MPRMQQVPGYRQAHATDSLAVVAWWLLAFAALDPARAADSTQNDESASVEQALTMLKEGADGHEVARMLEPLAYGSNGRAQLLLGGLYVEGRITPRDIVEGYAWFQVATTALEPAVASLAKQKLLAGEAAMSGAQLIRVEQRTIAIQAAIAERSYERFGAGLRAFTPERPVSFSPLIKFGTELVQLTAPTESQANPEFRRGCAATASPQCPASSQAVAVPRCTGRIAQADSGPSALPSAETQLVAPGIPAELRGRGFHGTAVLVLHVDHSGWICGAALAKSSGEPLWDAAALTTATYWRLKPAMLRGETVEGLHLLAVSANH